MDSYNSRQSAYFNLGTAGTADFFNNSNQEPGLSFGRHMIFEQQPNSFQNQAQSFYNSQLENDMNQQRYSPVDDQFEMKLEDMNLQNLSLHSNNEKPQINQKLAQSIQSDCSRNSKSGISNSMEQDMQMNSADLYTKFKPELKLSIPANQGKSIYREKIDLLLEKKTSTHSSISPCATPRTSKSQQKYERKKSQNLQLNSEQPSNDQNDQLDQTQLKLAKNRESAKNSRERKKIYQQLLEKQVQDLQDENEKLKEQCRMQENSIDQVKKSQQKFSLFIEQQCLLFQSLESSMKNQQIPEQTLQLMDAMKYKLSSAKNQFCNSNNMNNRIQIENKDEKVDEIWGTLKEILNPNQLGTMMCCIYNNKQQRQTSPDISFNIIEDSDQRIVKKVKE